MKLIIALCLVAAVAAAPPQKYNYSPDDVHVLKYDNSPFEDELGNYKFVFEQSDGQNREEEGVLRNKGQEDESIAVRGSYTWVGPDGVTYIVKYTADDNGFQPEIEQGPGGGVPPAVVASLLG